MKAIKVAQSKTPAVANNSIELCRDGYLGHPSGLEEPLVLVGITKCG